MKAIYAFCFLFLCIRLCAQPAKDHALLLRATPVGASQVLLTWQAGSGSAPYILYRRSNGNEPWKKISELPAASFQHTDTVTSFMAYEYAIRRKGEAGGNDRYAYTSAGAELPVKEHAGHMLLLVEQNYEVPLGPEIKGLTADLESDGWAVTRKYVQRTSSVTQVKAMVDDAPYTSLYLLGHIAVPYSGDIFPDGHRPEHRGAWPADVYYGTDAGSWTDVMVDHDSAVLVRNHNLAGDGKFDQDYTGNMPGGIKLEIGRVDLTSMPAFGRNDTLLTRDYLRKAHSFKTGALAVSRRAVIDDQFGLAGGEAFASNAWNNFTTMFGDSIYALDLVPALRSSDYLFSYGCGPGTFTSAGGIAATSDYVTDSLRSVFTGIFGSYFGDWDSENNLLRAPLCSGLGLASIWMGRPYWHLHHMAMGKHVGYAAKLAQQNYLSVGADDIPQGYQHNAFATSVHIALMGDPSLRLHYFSPVSSVSLSASADRRTIRIGWGRSPATGVSGYRIYRKSSNSTAFTFIVQLGVNDTFYHDDKPGNGVNSYMIRVVRKEQSASGSYFNMSLGVTDTITAISTGIISEHQQKLRVSVYPNPGKGGFFVEPEESATLEIWDATGKNIMKKEMNAGANRVGDDFSPGLYFIRSNSGSRSSFNKVIIY